MSVLLRWQYAALRMKRVLLPNSVAVFSGVGAPVNGTTGAGFAGPGSLYIDATVTTTKVYINTNTLASPTWVSVGSQT